MGCSEGLEGVTLTLGQILIFPSSIFGHHFQGLGNRIERDRLCYSPFYGSDAQQILLNYAQMQARSAALTAVISSSADHP